MVELKSKRLRFVPAYWAAIFDVAITIIHQPKEYWDGNLGKANEGNPFGAYMMANHVSGIFVISAIWLVIIGVVGYFLPPKFARVFLLFVLMVHTWGASTWISNHYGFWYVMAFVLFNSVLFYITQDVIQQEREVTNYS